MLKSEKSCRYKIFRSQSFVPRDGPKLRCSHRRKRHRVFLLGAALTSGMVGKDDNMKSRKSIAMMLAVMLTAASAAGPAFAAENSAQTAGTEQTSGAVFEDGTRDESQEKTRFAFTSSNTRAATADAAGTVTGKSAGTVTPPTMRRSQRQSGSLSTRP